MTSPVQVVRQQHVEVGAQQLRELVASHGAQGHKPESRSGSACAPFVVGHSYGGWVTMLCGRNDEEQELGGIVSLDSAVRPPDADGPGPPPRRKKKPGTNRKEDLLARFRLMPPQQTVNQYLEDYIAPLSIKEDEDGKFIWKDDPTRMQKTVFSGEDPASANKKDDSDGGFVPNSAFRKAMSERLRGIKCQMAVFYGRKSDFFSDPETLAYMRKELDEHPPGGVAHTPLIAIEGSQHHVMFDQPLSVVAGLRAVFGEWKRAATAAATGGGRERARL